MSRLTIYQDNYTDSTVISNRFIDEYMQDANDAQLKIYLYLIRMMSASRSTSISDIADLFNYTEKDVLRALKYWEKKRLLTLDYDEHKSVAGIHLMDFGASAIPAPVVSSAPLAPVVPISSKLGAGDPAGSNVPPNPAADGMQGSAADSPDEDDADDTYVKPNYTLDQLKAFKSDETTSRILFVTEQYLKRLLNVSEIQTILFISDKLGFSEDLIDYLIQYCVDLGKKEMHYIEKVAIGWAKQGVTTPKEAARLALKYDKSVYAVMRALGKDAVPTDAEASFVRRWTKEYGFTMDIVFDACERTVLNTDKNRFAYAESILSDWYKAGVHNMKDIQIQDERYQKTKRSRPTSDNKFNQFTQNSYDFDALEQELISN